MKAAIIGFGPHGKRILQALGRIEQIEIAGVVDANPDVLKSSEVPGEKRFERTSDLYSTCPEVDVLCIATNGPSHAPLTTEAITKGVKYILVEKPMACSVKDCLAMEKMATEKNVRLGVDKINRHDEVYQWLRQKLVSGEFGKLRSIYIQKPGIGLGCLGTHSFDLANYLADQLPVRVTGWVDKPVGKNPRGEQFVDPGGLVIIEYHDGTRAIVEQIEDGAGPLTIEIHCTAARVLYDPKNAFLDVRVRDLSVKPGPGKPPVYNAVALPRDLNLKGDMLKQVEAVIRELISDKPMSIDARFGRSAVEVLSAAYVSHQKENIPVNLPLTKEEDLSLFLPVT